LDCNICVAVCPHDALDLTQQLPLSDLLARQPALLLADYLEPCQRCGALTRNISPSEPTLCYACQPPTLYRQRTQRAHMATLARQLARQHEQAPSDST
jgi:ferredoxin